MKTLTLALILLVSGLSCSSRVDDTKVRVTCKADVPGFICEVKHLKGDRGVKVCWDTNIHCQEGPTRVVNKCSVIEVGGNNGVLVPYYNFGMSEGCEVSGLSVTNVEVYNKP